MHITCSRQTLSRGLAVVGRAVPSRSTLPILANIHLATDQGRLRLAATNLEMGITTWVDAQIQEEGATTLPAKLLAELVGSLSSESVELVTSEDTHVTCIQTARSQAHLRGVSPDEYPTLPSTEGSEPPIFLDAPLLKALIDQVALAAASDDSRPVFTGVLVHLGDDETLTCAAADGFRLAVRTVPLPGQHQVGSDLLIPARALEELARLLPSAGTVEMVVTPTRNQVLFHTETTELVTRLLEGTFPNYRQILPTEYTTRVVAETRELALVIKSAALFARDNSNILRLNVGAGEAKAEDLGDQTSTIGATVEGPGQEIILNVTYLADILAVIDTPEIALELVSASKPAVIKPVGSTASLYVVMSMHTRR